VGSYPPTPTLAPLDDGQIAEIVDVIDTQEIETARLAVDRARDPAVRALAESVLGADTRGRAQLLDHASERGKGLSSSFLLELLETRDREARAWLSNESGPTFDRDFLAYEVRAQTKELDWLDRILIPGAHAGALVGALDRRRTVVAERLRVAKELTSRIAAAPYATQL
jgi:predicted outer membrane protein